MHNPTDVVGKTALYFEKGVVEQVTRVVVTKHLEGDRFILSDFDNPDRIFDTVGWNFTIEKEAEQPEFPIVARYLAAYEKASAGA